MPESALLQISKILEIGYLHTVLTKAVLFLYMPESNQSFYPQVKEVMKEIRHSEPKMIAFRFRNLQDNRIEGVSSVAKMRWKRRNLVSMPFIMINWLLATVSLFPVMFGENLFFSILYLLVISCCAHLVLSENQNNH